MRVIIRFSLNNDAGSGLRNSLAPVLEGAGLVRSSKTATYEGDLNEGEIQKILGKFWSIAHAYTPAYIDHFWMYVDQQVDAKEENEDEENEDEQDAA